MYVSILPVEEELIVMEAVRVAKVQYLQKGEVSSDMASLCHISNARNTRSRTQMITIIKIFVYNELCHTYQVKWQNTANSFLMMCEYFGK